MSYCYVCTLCVIYSSNKIILLFVFIIYCVDIIIVFKFLFKNRQKCYANLRIRVRVKSTKKHDTFSLSRNDTLTSL